MKITAVEIKLQTPGSDPKLVGYVSITFDDCFVVHDIKLLVGGNGRMFVSMPGRQITRPCGGCGSKVPVLNRYCGRCGKTSDTFVFSEGGAQRFFHDICHPLNSDFRKMIENEVIAKLKNIKTDDEPESPIQFSPKEYTNERSPQV